ncbi:MAG: hypothetical protein HY898_17045 [Deltaproteobacteria bacterium]|nr:hypothetical protein [Deltaproteobacteria bacterium]
MRTLLLLALTSLVLGAGCSKPKTAPRPFDCPSFQQRARDCEQATIDLLRSKLTADAGDADKQFLMLESRLRKRIADGRPQKQCETILSGSDEARVQRIKTCHAAASCDSFAQCLMEL